MLGLRYRKRERQYSVVDLKRLEDLAELTITVKEPDLPVYVAGIFLNNKFRRLPVVSGGKIVGAITRYDLLRIIRTLAAMP